MKAVRIALAAAALLAFGPAAASAQTVRPRVFTPGDRPQDPPGVDVWLEEVSYDYGQRIRPLFSAENGAYVTIVRVTTDGELRVMYPKRPALQKPYIPGQTVDTRMSYAGTPAYNVYESRGTGFVFAIASYDRFDFSYFTSQGEWSVARLANTGRYGDPFEIVRMFIDRTLGERSDYSIDYVAYEVESRNVRSRYATRYAYNSFNDVYDRCLSAFGYLYSTYCNSYNNGYYGGVYYGPIIGGPGQPIPRGKREPTIRALVPDPLLPTSPNYDPPQRTEGRFPARVSGEAAASARRERLQQKMEPRVEMKSGGEATSQPRRSEPQFIETTFPMHRHPSTPRSEPRVYREPGVVEPVVRQREPVMRAEPQRTEPRVMQAAPPPRADPPRAEPQRASPPPVRQEPRAPAKEKDQQQ